MQNIPIYQKRVSRFIQQVRDRRYGKSIPLSVTYTYSAVDPIPISKLRSRKWMQIQPGTQWGELWGSAWFRVKGEIPSEFSGKEIVALVDLGSEGCVFKGETPYQGLTDVPRCGDLGSGKRRIMISDDGIAGAPVELLIEAGANALFGSRGNEEFVFRQADLAVFNRDMWQLGLDLEFLFNLQQALPKKSVRARRILEGLNRAANIWQDGRGWHEAAEICGELLSKKGNASATTAWSVGHAHLDLAWLWPVRETRRKAGRTFATALRLLDEYPDFVFGTSQPQVLAWVKEDYPELYEEIRAAAASGRWECQGAMWVEPDMNIPCGESLVRQLLYGKRFFRKEFGCDVDNLWLPDVFGYSAALPQILKLAGVHFFMTQKISWNETNKFPHHTFDWEGIDGSRIRVHFPPMNTYNGSNRPDELLKAEERFAQADVSDDWLNLYGIGDGGGGPSREHVERALRCVDTEGLPKVKLAPAHEFFKRLSMLPAHKLPVWRGELYLEFHRGTYTTQARLKRLNRKLETWIRDAEYLAAISGNDQREELAAIWQDILLNQFHDILPGTSIAPVYREANALSERNMARLKGLIEKSLITLHGAATSQPTTFVIHNTLSWEREALVTLPVEESSSSSSSESDSLSPAPVFRDCSDRVLPSQRVDNGYLVLLRIPSMGSCVITRGHANHKKEPSQTSSQISPQTSSETSPQTSETSPQISKTSPQPSTRQDTSLKATSSFIENNLLRVCLADDGTISSMYDKENSREVLDRGANRFLLWEDYPYDWDAWDISHYYRETIPEQARLLERRLVEDGPLRGCVEQRFSIGNSMIEQRVILEAGNRMIRLENRVNWKESGRMLRVQAMPAIKSFEAVYEIQFGVVHRPAHANTSWDAARFEVPAHRFADYSQPDYGFGMVNDCKYGHYIRDGVMELTLLRSPGDPDPKADLGKHEFIFGYYPHPLRWEESELLERAHELNSPVLLYPANLPTQEPVSEFAISGGNVKIETIKHAEDSKGLVLRLYETRGTDQKVTLISRRSWKRIQEVDLLEEPLSGGLKISAKESQTAGLSDMATLEFKPFQIRSFLVEFSGDYNQPKGIL